MRTGARGARGGRGSDASHHSAEHPGLPRLRQPSHDGCDVLPYARVRAKLLLREYLKSVLLGVVLGLCSNKEPAE